jgi:hypothetical protein
MVLFKRKSELNLDLEPPRGNTIHTHEGVYFETPEAAALYYSGVDVFPSPIFQGVTEKREEWDAKLDAALEALEKMSADN